MRYIFHSKQVITTKIVFIFVTLVSGILFVTGSIAAEDCRQYSHSGIKSFDGNSALCNACCNSEASQGQCCNQCSLPIDLPKVALVSNGGMHSDSLGIAAAPVKYYGQIPNAGSNPYIISIEKIYKAPPIFLQNESFLI